MEATTAAGVEPPSPPAAPPSNRIRSIEIIGGYLGGERLELSTGLNCLIGARGTGKTTAIEFVRFALDALPDPQSDPADRKRIESLIQQNLNGGRVELEIETRDGLSYRISRAAGEKPLILTADGLPTDIQLRAGGLFKADVYSQNEVERIADQSLSQLELIDDFAPHEIRQVSGDIAHVEQSLAANAGSIHPIRQQIESLTGELGSLPEIGEKLRGYAEGAGGADEPVNKAHTLKALRDRETRALEGTAQALDEYRSQIEGMAGRLVSRTRALFPNDLITGPNGKHIERVQQEITGAGAEIDILLDEAMRRLDRARGAFEDSGRDLAAAHNRQEIEFRKVIERHQAAQTQAAERSRLERLRNALLAKQRQRDELTERLAALLSEREALTRQLSDLRDRRFQIRQSIVDRINEALAPSIRVSILQSGNPQPYFDRLVELLRGVRIRHNVVAQRLVNAFWPADLVSVIQARDTRRLIDEAELNAEQADRVIASLVDSPALLELEAVELIDQPRVELRDGGSYKDSTALSTGQKCTTILPILLLDSDNPLLVDQPEDNLDNRFIYECVVEKVRDIKSRRQLVFVTHNPNIPVLADAERIFVFESDGARACIEKCGSVDDCKEEIVTLLEGGEEAFKERRRRYDY
ncbi:MAG: AAA family ATPase [Phycisphaerales bacterium]|nr:AAA family ATPase [Phycisphaerales bacterium]